MFKKFALSIAIFLTLFAIPAEAVPTLIAHGAVAGASGGTTTAGDYTGVNLIVIAVSPFQGNAASLIGPTDSSLNTYTPLTRYTAGRVASIQLFYCLNPTVTSSMTFTFSGGVFGSMAVAGFSGVATSSAFDQATGAAPGTTPPANSTGTVQPGSLTPANSGSLFVAALAASDDTMSPYGVDSSFIVTDSVYWLSFTYEGVLLSYKVSSGAENPNLSAATGNSPGDLAAAMVIFKPSGAAPPTTTPRRLSLLGVGN